MSHNPSTPFFFFPPEIENEIFQWVVRIRPYHPTDASLSVVSKGVQACIEPMLYKTVKLHGSCEYANSNSNTAHESNFAVALNSKPPSFFMMHVRNLCLTATVSKELASRILSVCTGVQNLALWLRGPELDIGQITRLKLRSLDTNREVIKGLSKLHIAFPELRILSATYRPDQPLPTLEWLPSLSHVYLSTTRFHVNVIPGDLNMILETVKNLQSIFIRIHKSHGWFDSDQARVEVWADIDSKIVFEDEPRYPVVRDWEERIELGIPQPDSTPTIGESPSDTGTADPTREPRLRHHSARYASGAIPP